MMPDVGGAWVRAEEAKLEKEKLVLMGADNERAIIKL